MTKTGEKYKVEITGLDKKSESFEGVAKGDTIEFKRNDKTETIKAATAEETGMKWLQVKRTASSLPREARAIVRNSLF